MKFIVNKNLFSESLNIVERAISNRNTLPVQNNVYLELKGNKLMLITTNLEIAIKTEIDVTGEEDGKTTVPVKLLSDYISLLKSDQITIALHDGETLSINTDESDTKIKGISPEEFPLIPEIEIERTINLPVKTFIENISKIVFASALDELRPVLAGVFIKVENGIFYSVATDSYRLVEMQEKSDKTDDFSLIIPSRTVLELSRVLHKLEKEEIKIDISKNQIKFSCKQIEMMSRLIEGQYPDYYKIIPQNIETTAVLDTQNFITTIKRASLFAKENSNSIKIKLKNDHIEILVDLSQTGSEKAVIPAKVQGDEKEIAFNAQYLIDALSNISEDEIEIGVNSSVTPGLIKPVGKEGILHVIMPLKV